MPINARAFHCSTCNVRKVAQPSRQQAVSQHPLLPTCPLGPACLPPALQVSLWWAWQACCPIQRSLHRTSPAATPLPAWSLQWCAASVVCGGGKGADWGHTSTWQHACKHAAVAVLLRMCLHASTWAFLLSSTSQPAAWVLGAGCCLPLSHPPCSLLPPCCAALRGAACRSDCG